MQVSKYSKAIVAGVAAALIVATAAMSGTVIDPQAVIAVLAALGVWAVPNKKTP